MRYLLLMDGLRANVAWIVLAFLSCAAALMLWAPQMRKRWTRVAVRALGVMLLVPIFVFSFLGAFVWHDPPRQRIGFTSRTGARVALLSHSETRDSSATRVTIQGDGCCSQYIAYEYYGDGEDYIGAKSIRWIDDHHLTIEYSLDPTGVQKCYSQAGDVQILCEPQSAPSFHSKSGGR